MSWEDLYALHTVKEGVLVRCDLCIACRGHGRAIVLCVGGAREALLAEQEQFQIVLGKRMVLISHDPKAKS